MYSVIYHLLPVQFVSLATVLSLTVIYIYILDKASHKSDADMSQFHCFR